MEAFTRAFLGAGAAATVTSLWRVADQPAADFMQQFYYFLAQGQSKAKALRAAKLSFLHSNSALANPRHWAAFVLYGDGWNPCARVIPWSAPLIAAALAILVLWLALRVQDYRSRGAANPGRELAFSRLSRAQRGLKARPTCTRYG